jgi:hypothetical protein
MTVAEAKKLWNHRLGEDALVAEQHPASTNAPA